MKSGSISIWLLLALLSTLLYGCSKSVEPLHVATNLWAGYEPLYLARDLGKFENTPVKLVEMPSSSEVIRVFRNDAVDVAALTLDEVLLLLQDGIDLRILFVMDISNGADVIMARSGIDSMRALAGKKVGVESSALGAYMLSRALQRAKMIPSDIEVVPLTLDQHEQAFKSGKVDAVVTFEPVKTRLLGAGAHVIFDSSMIPNEIFDVLVTRRSLYEQRRADFEQLTAAWFRTLSYVDSNPMDAARRAAGRLGVTPAQYLDALKGLSFPDSEANKRLLFGPNPAILHPARVLGETMLRQKLLTRAVDPARLLEPGAVQ